MNRRAFLLGSAVLGLVGPKRVADVVTSTAPQPNDFTEEALERAMAEMTAAGRVPIYLPIRPDALWPGVKAWYEKNCDPSQWDGIFGD